MSRVYLSVAQQTNRFRTAIIAMFVVPILAGLVALSFGQAPAPPQEPIFGAALVGDVADPKCSLVFPSNDLTKIIIQKEDGTVILDAKEFTLDMRPGQVPLVTCQLFRGVYRPTKPTTKRWAVIEIKFVEADAFQRLVDDAVTLDEGAPATPAAANTIEPAEIEKPAVPVPPTVPLNPAAPKPPKP